MADGEISTVEVRKFRSQILQVREYFLKNLLQKEYTVYRGMKLDLFKQMLKTAQPKITSSFKEIYPINVSCENLVKEINHKKPVIYDQGLVSTSTNETISAKRFHGKDKNRVFCTIYIPKNSKALVLDYEGIQNLPEEEEILLAERTKMKINSIKVVTDHFEIDAEVVR